MRSRALLWVLAVTVAVGACGDPVASHSAALSEGVTICNLCDPSCRSARDVPERADLTPDRATHVVYDSHVGGISLESTGSAAPPLVDSDGDGVPDDADDCVGPGAFLAADGSCYGDAFFYHSLPYGGPPEADPLDLQVTVRTADVFFLMDTTGSMGGEIANLRDSLTSGELTPGCPGGIIGATRCAIPDAWFGVGRFDDYRVSPYGGGEDEVYRTLQPISASASDTSAAVASLGLHNGWDLPESNSQALWAVSTGGELGPYLASASCPAGRWGHPCFREDAIPVLIHFTDAPFHNGPSGNLYDFAATASTVTPVSGNDDLGSAYSVGNLVGRLVSYSGNTCALTNRIGGTTTCERYASTGGDAVFSFRLSRRTRVVLNLDGTAATYPTLTLLDSGGAYQSCAASWTTTGARFDVTLDAGTYYAVVESYDRYCGDYQINLGDYDVAAATVRSYPVSWAQAVDALSARSVRVITVYSGPASGQADSDALADATGAISSTGRREVFAISADGTGLGAAVVDSIVELAGYERMDVSVRAVDDPSTAIDERGFLDSVVALGWGAGSCEGTTGGGTFTQCLPGTELSFQVAFANDIVAPSGVNQVFDFYLEVVGDGTYVLDRVPVRILVPGLSVVFAPEGRYARAYDASDVCAPNERPIWTSLSWVAPRVPSGTSITFELRSGDTADDARGARKVEVVTPSAASPVDITRVLDDAGVRRGMRHLHVTAVLRANDTLNQSPTLREMEVRWLCVPME